MIGFVKITILAKIGILRSIFSETDTCFVYVDRPLTLPLVDKHGHFDTPPPLSTWFVHSPQLFHVKYRYFGARGKTTWKFLYHDCKLQLNKLKKSILLSSTQNRLITQIDLIEFLLMKKGAVLGIEQSDIYHNTL